MKDYRQVRCDICGRFISDKELNGNGIKAEFTSDTHFTVEKTSFIHRKCKVELLEQEKEKHGNN